MKSTLAISNMNAYEINKRLDSLYQELEAAYSNDEQTVCMMLNTDNKKEAIQLITDEIDSLEKELEEIEALEACGDDGMDYNALCYSLGISRYA